MGGSVGWSEGQELVRTGKVGYTFIEQAIEQYCKDKYCKDKYWKDIKGAHEENNDGQRLLGFADRISAFHTETNVE
jgi:hypothetical protein